MKWYDNLYIGDSIAHKADRIRWRVEHRRIIKPIYLITFPSNPDNLLDIIPARDLWLPGYPRQNLRIIGMAGDYDEALSLVQQIVEETLQETDTTDIRSYLKSKRGQEA